MLEMTRLLFFTESTILHVNVMEIFKGAGKTDFDMLTCNLATCKRQSHYSQLKPKCVEQLFNLSKAFGSAFLKVHKFVTLTLQCKTGASQKTFATETAYIIVVDLTFRTRDTRYCFNILITY